MKPDAPTLDQLEQVRQWRNDERQFLRTPYFLTEEMQQRFYRDVVDNRDSKHRYYALVEAGLFIGLGGLTNIEWENSRAEISLIINPEYRGKGYGKEAVRLLLAEGFGNMGLKVIWGEVYKCGNVGFWEACAREHHGETVHVPWPVKRWQGVDYGSLLFAFEEAEWSA